MTGAVTNPAGALQIDTTAPTISSLTESPSSGDLNAGKTVTLTLNLSEAVTVAGGTPTLTLNDGGTATYTGGSGTNALTFSYTVGAGQNTAALAATAVNLNSATVTDGAGNAANLSLTGLTQSGPQIDTTTPTVSSVTTSGSGITSGSGDLGVGKTVTFTVAMSEAVTVNTTGGTPDAHPQRWRHRHLYRRLRHQCTHLQLHRGCRAEHVRPDGHCLQRQRRYDHQMAPALPPTMTGAVTNPAGTLQIDTTAPTISSLTEFARERRPQCRQDRHADAQPERGSDGAGGTPTLTLNDGGTATYTGGSGTNALTFSYTVGAGQNTSALAATAVNLNSATITDGAGNAANLSLTGLTQSGTADRHHHADGVIGDASGAASPAAAATSTPARPSRSPSNLSEAVTVTRAAPRRSPSTMAAPPPIPAAPAPMRSPSATPWPLGRTPPT